MVKVNFNLRSTKKNQETPINMVIRWNNLRLVAPTGQRVTPSLWDKNKQRVKQITIPRGITVDQISSKEKEEYDKRESINTVLSSLKSKVSTKYNEFYTLESRYPLSSEEMRSCLATVLNLNSAKKKEEPKEKSFFEHFDSYIKTKEHPKTKAWYQNTKNKLEHFNSKLTFDDIDNNFHTAFIKYLEDKQYSKNSIATFIKNLKAFLNHSTDQGINTNLKFRTKAFNKKPEKSTSIALTDSEVNDVYNLDLSDNRKLDRVRDLFIVACRTGLRFSDFSNIDNDSIGDQYINLITKKTDQKVVIPIHHQVKEIITKYSNQTDNSLPKPISNQKFNEYIKKVASKVDSLKELVIYTKTIGGKRQTIKKPKHQMISSHTGRRTFATINYENKVPFYSIMAITGHKTESAFREYVKTDAEKHAEILRSYWNKTNPQE